MKFALLLTGLLLSLNVTANNTLSLNNARIPEAPPGASVMAGYMEIHNNSHKNIDIISISSNAFKSVEMHLSKESDGFAKMLPQKKLSVPANDKLILKPGSYHLMLIKPVKWLRHGDKVKLNFKLSDSTETSLEISVQKMTVKKNSTPAMKCAAGKCGGR